MHRPVLRSDQGLRPRPMHRLGLRFGLRPRLMHRLLLRPKPFEKRLKDVGILMKNGNFLTFLVKF
jgi:hypothetical protein